MSDRVPRPRPPRRQDTPPGVWKRRAKISTRAAAGRQEPNRAHSSGRTAASLESGFSPTTPPLTGPHQCRRSPGRGAGDHHARSVRCAPDPARLERAATLTDCGLGAPLPGRCALGGFVSDGRPLGRPRESGFSEPAPERRVDASSGESIGARTFRGLKRLPPHVGLLQELILLGRDGGGRAGVRGSRPGIADNANAMRSGRELDDGG